MRLGQLLATALVAALLSIAAIPAHASPNGAGLAPKSLAHAQAIRTELDARYRALPGRGLRVTEATSTGIVRGFALLTPDLLGARFLPADNGIWYGICPAGATCPYPARRASPPGDAAARRLALELALRTFLETSASVVAVSLPTRHFTAFIVGRDELVGEVGLAALARALSGNPARMLSASAQAVVDGVTRPRIFVFTGLEPTPNGGDYWGGIPRWPSVRT